MHSYLAIGFFRKSLWNGHCILDSTHTINLDVYAYIQIHCILVQLVIPTTLFNPETWPGNSQLLPALVYCWLLVSTRQVFLKVPTPRELTWRFAIHHGKTLFIMLPSFFFELK